MDALLLVHDMPSPDFAFGFVLQRSHTLQCSAANLRRR
jgi:hypothetical protein